MSEERAQPPSRPMTQVGAARARTTFDSPDSLFGFGGFGSISSPDYENEWRDNSFDDQTLSRISTPELLLRLVDLSPEISKGLWDFLRFANAGWEMKAYRLGGSEQVEDKRGAAVLDAFIARLKAVYGSFDVVLNRLFISAFLRGSFFAELVLDPRGREAVDIATPDPRWVLFERRNDPERGAVFVPYQQQQGKRVYLDRETVRYVPVDPVPGSPFGRALATPAVFATLFSLGLLRDLRRVVAQQGYPRIDITIMGENLKNWIPETALNDPEELDRQVTALIRQAEEKYRTLAPDDAFIHTDSYQLNRPVGTLSADSLGAVDGLVKYLERTLARAAKSTPLHFGITEGMSEANANRLSEAYLGGIKAVQHLCESLMEHLLTLALQAQGIQARVEWRFQEVRAAEMMRDQQTQRLRLENAALAWALGYVSQEEAANMALDRSDADAEEPRVLPTMLQSSSDPTLMENPEPGTDRLLKRSDLPGMPTNDKH